MKYAGLDLHKSRSYVTVVDEGGQIVDEANLKSNSKTINNYLSQYNNPQVVFEATRNWYWLYEALQREGIEVKMAHPKKTKAVTEAKVKTDRIDSKMLAHLLRTDLVPESYLAPLEVRELRELLRHRIFLVRERAKFKVKIRSLLAKLNLNCPRKDVMGEEAIQYLEKISNELPQVFEDELRTYLRLGKNLTREIELVEAKIEVEAKDNEIVALLVTIPGVGDFTALLIVAEIGEIERFDCPEKLSSYSGLTPSVHSSGNKTRTGEITKQGNPWLRWALVEASWKLKNKSDHFQEFFERVAKKKGKNVAVVATARKLSVAIWHMWKRREPFKEPA